MQDINLSDRELRADYIAAWQDNDMSGMTDIIDEPQMDDKAAIATVFNDITTDILALESGASGYKASVIKISATPPAGIISGQVYFKIV